VERVAQVSSPLRSGQSQCLFNCWRSLRNVAGWKHGIPEATIDCTLLNCTILARKLRRSQRLYDKDAYLDAVRFCPRRDIVILFEKLSLL